MILVGLEGGEEYTGDACQGEETVVDPANLAPPSRDVVRVVTPGMPKFQLRAHEPGLSVFDPQAVSPPLTEAEILGSFRHGGQTVRRSVAEIEAKGLRVVSVPGDPSLPLRLQEAHAEILPGLGMTRTQFKKALKGLE